MRADLQSPDEPTAGRPFVGRRQEIAGLALALDEALAGGGSLALLVGEPGIGKSRTAEEFAVQARARGARVLWGSCFEAEGAPAFWPWVQVLRPTTDLEDSALGEQVAPGTSRAPEGSGSLAMLLRDAGGTFDGPSPLASLPPERARFRLFDGVASLLQRMAEEQPLLVVVDDLHWADQPSLLLLEFLTREIAGSRILLLATYRADALSRRHPLSDVLGRLTSARRFLLRGFSAEEIGELLEVSPGVEASTGLADAVRDMTDGNPFFVSEVLRLISSDPRLAAPGGEWSPGIPQGVREVIGRRLAGLGEDSVRVLRLASVVGREFGLPVLARVADQEPEEALRALEEASRAGLVEEAPAGLGRFRFSHALVRETLYAELTTIQRVRDHRRVAETLEELYGPSSDLHVNEMAHHYLEAAPAGDVERAVEYARRAAERAVALLAYEEAVRLYEAALQALDLLGDDERTRCELLLGLADAHWRAGGEAAAEEHVRRAVEVARRVGDPELIARAALGGGAVVVMLGLAIGGVNEPEVALLEEALAGLDTSDSALRVQLLARLSAQLYWTEPASHRDELSAEAVKMARRLEDPAALAYALSARHWAIWGPDTLDERRAIAAETRRLAARSGNRLLEGLAMIFEVLDQLEAGDIGPAFSASEAMARMADELHDATYMWFASMFAAARALVEGRTDEGEQMAAEAFQSGVAAMTGESTWATMAFACQQYCVAWHRGDLEKVEGALRSLIRAIPTMPIAQCILAEASSELGRETQARADFEAVAAKGFRALPRDASWVSAMSELAFACAYLGDRGRAAELYDLLSPFADRHVVVGPGAAVLGSASFSLGLLATTLERWDEADEHFDRAEAENRRTGQRTWLALAQYRHAETLLRRGSTGDAPRAAALGREAAEIAELLGMRKLAADVKTLLGSAGAGAERPPAVEGAVFRREGDYWTVGLDGAAVRLKDAKGLRYLAHLLERPGAEIHVLDLVVSTAESGPGAREVAAEGLSAGRPGDAGEVIDPQARSAYRSRVEELRGELEEAERFNDPERAARARWELDAIAEQLSSAVGLGGRPRRAASPSERARVNVRNAITASLKAIRAHDEPLWRHLDNAIKTGTFCSYRPESPVAWDV